MKIFTYHDDVPELPNHRALVALWRERWAAAGWEPVVLSQADAQKHPDYARLKTKFAKLPTVNPAGYELACYLRWVAMAVVGGGWMSDADVIPYTFAPRPPTNRLTLWSRGCCPCLVSGDPAEYLRLVETFAAWVPTNKDMQFHHGLHCSDQNIFDQLPGAFDHQEICLFHLDPGWETAPVIHYPNERMENHQPRHEWIPKLR